MTQVERQNEALTRATSSQSVMNYAAIFEGFGAMGIPADDIRPRENILSYHAWRAVGRQVRKGEHGVHVLTFIRIVGKADTTESADDATTTRTAGYSRPKGTTVFHVSQTDPIKGI